MQMEFEACTDELPWIIICYLCAVNDYPVRVPYTNAFASFPRSTLKIGNEGVNGSEGHFTTYS